jgi:ferrous iron transport protein B
MMPFPGLDQSKLFEFQAKRDFLTQAAPAGVMAEIEAATGDEGLSAQALAVKGSLTAVDGEEAQAVLRNSVAGRLGMAMEGVSSLAGFDWQTNIALVGGFAAKEVVVSTLGTAYSLGDVDPEETDSLGDRLKATPGWGPVNAFSLIIFTIFYAPCFVTVVCIAREAGSWKWAGFSVVFNTVLAFGLSVLTYQVGSLLF